MDRSQRHRGSQSQAAGLALLDAEGEGLAVQRTAMDIRLESNDGFDPFDVIRTVDNAYSQTGGLSMLNGNLAPKGAVVKTAGVAPKCSLHTGPAVIFESEKDAYNGIVFGKVKAGDVVVIRNEGPKGGPGCKRCWRRPPRSRASASAKPAPRHRRPLLGRDRRGLDRPRQPRGGRRRADRLDSRWRHH